MSRPPSEATQIRTLKRQLVEAQSDLSKRSVEAIHYRKLATTAEQEVKDWKERFDLLLRLKPGAAQPPSSLACGANGRDGRQPSVAKDGGVQ